MNAVVPTQEIVSNRRATERMPPAPAAGDEATTHGALLNRLVALPGLAKVLIFMSLDFVALCLAKVLSCWVLGRAGLNLDSDRIVLVVLAGGSGVVVLILFHCYDAMMRYVNMRSITRAATAAALGWLPSGVIGYALGVWPGGLKAFVVGPLLASVSVMGWRLLAHQILMSGAVQRQQQRAPARVLIYGAGEAGRQLATALTTHSCYRPVGFIDDRVDFNGREVLGLPVRLPSALDRLQRRGVFDEVMLAIPAASRSRRRDILQELGRKAIKVQVVPSLEELISGAKRVDQVRSVLAEDLLGRDPVPAVQELMDRQVRDCNVLITGAGGSIGSELCRQVLKAGARRLVLFERCEYALYQIEHELREIAARVGCELVPMLGDVLDRQQLDWTLRRYAVQTIYHAAAYKHVPLVERNVIAAVRNNVFGTANTVRAAAAAGVSNFVLVSTDKAVRPTNVMGATKRVCELVVQSQAGSGCAMRTAIVRFGNVLGSSGSVVPLFKEQIANGGPVTVTHPEITRYFMTIPEAAQLVIQAGAMGERGEVFVLDMGESVSIAELARRMICLSGLQIRSEDNPDGDIEICFTGLRPGEKLHEELLIGSRCELTSHARIFLDTQESAPERPILDRLLARLERAIATQDSDEVFSVFRALVERFDRCETQPPKAQPIEMPLPSIESPPPLQSPPPQLAGAMDPAILF